MKILISIIVYIYSMNLCILITTKWLTCRVICCCDLILKYYQDLIYNIFMQVIVTRYGWGTMDILKYALAFVDHCNWYHPFHIQGDIYENVVLSHHPFPKLRFIGGTILHIPLKRVLPFRSWMKMSIGSVALIALLKFRQTDRQPDRQDRLYCWSATKIK